MGRRSARLGVSLVAGRLRCQAIPFEQGSIHAATSFLSGGFGWLALGLATSAAFGSVPASTLAQEASIGFAPGSRAAQTKFEAHALAVPTPDAARAWLRGLTEEPHVAGTPADHKTALDLAEKLKSWGWDTEIVEYEVLLNYPIRVNCEISRPTRQVLKMTEDLVIADKDSGSGAAFPAFHGYGVSGDANAQVVYANFGRLEDFSALEKMGVDVRGKVVLVRYGELFRGLKVRNAQQKGAKGILIYSDPGDDGFAKGDVFPDGPYRSGSSLQRGSVQFLSLGPGDPSTPGVPSIKGAKRLPWSERNGMPLDEGMLDPMSVKDWEKETGQVRNDYYASIPSLPISYDAARPILEAMGGANVPPGWQGGLPLAYHVGPGPVEVQMAVQMQYKIRPIWNVVAKIKGEVEPDRWVMIGNHRDAWVYGAVDPSSGTSATMEMCRALGSAVNNGWKPKRTLLYASWDAEEYGLVGSTEWADQFSDAIKEKAVLMLNVDSAVSGPNLDIDGVPSLRDLMLEATGAVTDIRSGRTLRDLWVAKKRAAWAGTASIDLDGVWEGNGEESKPEASAATARKFSPMLNPLGSGSDYTAFLDHLGVPAVDAGFSGKYGVYHSIYDDFFWMEKFGDPEFLTHATAARLYTLIAMRAAGADVVPLRFVPYGEALREYLDDLRRMVARKARASDGEPARLVFEGMPKLVAAIKAFESQATILDAATDALSKRDGVPQGQLSRVNDALTQVERAFLLPKGLPGRPWFKHAIYAPGLTTGYAAWPMPGVRQAVNDGDLAMLSTQTAALIERIDAATAALKTATEAAGAAPGGPGVAQPAPAAPGVPAGAAPATPAAKPPTGGR